MSHFKKLLSLLCALSLLLSLGAPALAESVPVEASPTTGISDGAGATDSSDGAAELPASALLPTALERATPYTLTKEDCVLTPNDDGSVTLTKVLATVTATDIIIPDTLDGKPVTVIGAQIFPGTYPTVTNVTLPSGLIEIGDSAFRNCSSLTKIAFPDTLTTIGKEAFRFSSKLADITWGASLISVGNEAFDNTALHTLPATVTTLGDGAFSDTNITAITAAMLPNVTALPASLFNDCDLLATVELHSGVSSLGASIFANCDALTTVVLPEGLTEVPDHAFTINGDNTSSLTSVAIPDTVTRIGNSAFSANSKLTNINLPSSLKTLGNSAFTSCTALNSIAIPDGVKILDVFTFSGCSALQTITLPSGLTTVKNNAFEQCTALQSLTFPSGLASLHYTALVRASGLRSVIFEGDAPDTSGSNPFPVSNSNITLYHPVGNTTYEGWASWIPLKSGTPVEPTKEQATIALTAQLCKMPQSNLVLWLTTQVTPTAHPDDPALAPNGVITTTIDGVVQAAPVHFTGGGNSTYRTFGYDVTNLVGSGITVSVALGDSWGFTGSSSNELTGTIVAYTDDDYHPFGISSTKTEYDWELDTAGTGVVLTALPTAVANSTLSIVLPSALDGKTVTGLGAGLFAGTPVTRVAIPNTVKTLGASVFEDCHGLTDITLPAGVEALGADVFKGSGLTSVTMEGNAPTLVDGNNPFPANTILKTASGATGYEGAPWKDMKRTPVELLIKLPTITNTAEFFDTINPDKIDLLLAVTFDTSAYGAGAPAPAPAPDWRKLAVFLGGRTVEYTLVSTTATGPTLRVSVPSAIWGTRVNLVVRYPGDSTYAAATQQKANIVSIPIQKAALTITSVAAEVKETEGKLVLWLTPTFSPASFPGQPSVTPKLGDTVVTLNGAVISNTAYQDQGKTTVPIADNLRGKTVNVGVTFASESAQYFKPPNPNTPCIVSVTIPGAPVTPDPVPPSGGGGGGGSAPAPAPSAPVNVKVTVSDSAVKEAIKSAEPGQAVVLTADVKEGATSVAVTVSAGMMKAIAKAEAPVSLKTPVADLTLDVKVLEALQAKGVKDVVVSAGAADTAALPKAAQDSLAGRPVYDINITAGGKGVSQFDGGTVTVALPYTPTQTENSAALVACWVKDDGTMEVLQSSSFSDGKLSFKTPHLSTYAIVHREVSFPDVAEDYWAKAPIDFVVARGILSDTGDDLFSPTVSLTGTMAVVALARMDGVAIAPFGDGWADPALEWAAEKRILPDGFSPDAALSREHLAYLVAGYMGGAKAVSVSNYLDMTDISAQCLLSVQYLNHLGVMNGTGDGYFSPQLPLSRGELAAVLQRLVTQ